MLPPPDHLVFDEHPRLKAVTRLYLVVHGRSPDRDGLVAYMGHLRDGTSLEDLATGFLQSGEFRDRVGDRDPRALLYQHAWGADVGMPPAVPGQSLSQLVAALVHSPEVQARFPILPSLYPDGVPLDAPDYRMWLLSRPVPVAAAGPVPSFAILLDRPDPGALAEAVRSVLCLPIPLELVVAARWPVAAGVRKALGSDARVRLVQAPPWSSRAALFNRALAQCAGAFVGLIGQHDRLDAAVAALPAALRDTDIAITDDDRLGMDGSRQDPRLGNAWDPDRTLAAGCPGLILIRTALARQVGGMRPCAGREEWAMLLRVAAVVEEGRIVHVPLVTLSRREVPTAGSVQPAHVAAVEAFLRTKRQAGSVRARYGLPRVVYPLPAAPPLVSVIIPTRDRADLLRRCMDGLLTRTAYPALEVVIVDNGSAAPDALALLRDLVRDPRVRLLPHPGPFNWSALNNAGVASMRGQVAVLLNNDIDVLEPGWLREMVSQAMRPEVGVVGAKLLYGDGRVQHAGVVLGPAGRASHMWRYLPGDARGYLDQLVTTRRVTAMTGACLAIRAEVYQAAGGCEAENLPVTWNDADLCLRIGALGLRAIWTPHARLLHLEQATRGTDDTPENQVRFLRERTWMRARWGDKVDYDPFLSPNLLPSETNMRLVTCFR